MAKIKWILIAAAIFMLASCSSEQNEKKENTNKESDEESVEVDKGLVNVEITVPAEFLEDQDIDAIIAEAKQSGVKEVNKNDDGSLTYTMSKSQHKKMMKEMAESIAVSVEETKNSEDYASIKDINYNKSFSKFSLVVDQQAFENSFDGFAVLGLALEALYYQAFDGVDPENYEVTFELKDESTGKVFDTIVYPEALEE